MGTMRVRGRWVEGWCYVRVRVLREGRVKVRIRVNVRVPAAP